MKRGKQDNTIDLSELAVEILNSVNDIILITDLEGRIAYVNRRAEAIGGYSPGKILGQPLSAFWRDGGQWEAKMAKVLQSQSREEYEEEFSDRSGGKHLVDVTMIPLKNDQGELNAIGIIGRDITEIRKLEIELNSRAGELEGSLRELETLVHTLSHDLRTPLISVQGFAKLLAKKYGDRLDEKGIDYLDRLKREADRIEGVLQDRVRAVQARRGE